MIGGGWGGGVRWAQRSGGPINVRGVGGEGEKKGQDPIFRRVGPKTGGNEEGETLEAVQPVKVERVFIANQKPELTAKRLREYLGERGVKTLAVHKLKTRYPRYSSFCVEVTEGGAGKVADERNWGEGTLVRSFEGRPAPGRIEETAAGEEGGEGIKGMET